MVEIVERKDKPYLQVFLSVIGSVVLIDFVIFIANKYAEKHPYLTNIIVLFLLIFTCSAIIIKYFSKYKYILEDNQLIFHRLIGKKAFPILQIDLNDISIKPYNNNDDIHFKYKFIFGKDYNNSYVGKYNENGTDYYFVFQPSTKMQRELDKKIK